MSSERLTSIVARIPWQRALGLLAGLVVIASGLALGRVLLSPRWTQAATLIGMTAAALVILARPRLGLLLWVLLIPFADGLYLKIDLGDLPDLDISRMAMLLLAFLVISQPWRLPQGGPWRLPQGQQTLRAGDREGTWLARLDWPDFAMWGFMVGISLSVRPSLLRDISGGYVEVILRYIAVPLAMYFFAPWFVFYLSRSWLRTRPAFMTAVGVIALSSAALGVIATQEQLTGQAIFSPVPWSYMAYEGNIRKVLSLFGTPTLMTTALATAVPFLLYGVREASSLRTRLLLGVALLLTLVGDFFVFVRAGWLSSVSGILLMVLLDPGTRRIFVRLLPAIIVVAAVIGVVAVSPQVVGARITSEAPIGYRFIAWEIAWDLFRQSPVGGIGYHAFGYAAMEQYGWRPHEKLGLAPAPHNSFLYVMVSGGLIAFIPYLAIFATLAWRGLTHWRQGGDRRLIAALWATLLGYTEINMTLDSLNGHYHNVLLFLICGAILGRLEETGGRG
ncbi:MAG: O-antigen ligase family protein [Chloroflexi bacterium]|nr:O-antigen ligase family protein [Chloroflexota bacterium]